MTNKEKIKAIKEKMAEAGIYHVKDLAEILDWKLSRLLQVIYGYEDLSDRDYEYIIEAIEGER